MSKVAVVYWSGTGNTKQMAEAVLEGAKGAGADASIFEPDGFNADAVSEYDAIAFACDSVMANEIPDDDTLKKCNALGAALV